MRPLALALVVVLSASSSAHAVLVTGRAMGAITLNGSPPGTYQFTPGEAVFVTFEYDPQLSEVFGPAPPSGQRYLVRPGTFGVTTGGGFAARGTPPPNSLSSQAIVVNGATDIFELEIFTGSSGITLRFTDPTGTALSSTALPTLAELLRFPGGTLDYGREFDGVGFRATVVPVADFPVPEPSTLALGLIGVGVLGLARHKVRLSCKV
jgi:hypothetical protein